jgi:sugar phosphate isomerase/epimerase
MSDFSRRDFLRTTAMGAAALTAESTRLFAARKKLPIGVQLYSVRQQMAKDVPGTLAGVKKVGYDGVEFAGYFKYEAKALRKLLDDNGLKCCGSHTALATLQGDELAKTIEYNKILGNQYLVVPSLPPAKTLADWDKFADSFNAIAVALKRHKMYVGYHNHTAEFKQMDGQVQLEHFFGKTKKEVFMQVDVGHWAHAGGDPVALIKKFPGRSLTVHAKDWSDSKKDAVVGEGIVKWPEVIKACESVGKTKWYIIEEESGMYQGLAGIERSLQGLKKLLA